MLRDGQLCGGDGMNVPAYPASPHAVRRIVAVQHGEKPVLHPANDYRDSTAYFAICRVVVSQRRNHSASLLRLAD